MSIYIILYIYICYIEILNYFVIDLRKGEKAVPGSLDPVDPDGSSWILMDPHGSYGAYWILWCLLDPMVPTGSSWILMDPDGSY